jgi:hypothetical protein
MDELKADLARTKTIRGELYLVLNAVCRRCANYVLYVLKMRSITQVTGPPAKIGPNLPITDDLVLLRRMSAARSLYPKRGMI